MARSETHGRNELRSHAQPVGRVSRVMRELLDVMGLEAGTVPIDRGPHRVARLVGDAIFSVEFQASAKGVTLDGLVRETPEVFCDRARVVEVLVQLLTNAIDASPAGESIVVRAELADGFVVTSVQDAGPGIDIAAWPYIFDGVWQNPGARDDAQRHAGLGLALCRASVRAHGGDIWVESRIGEGSIFSFSLPVHAN